MRSPHPVVRATALPLAAALLLGGCASDEPAVPAITPAGTTSDSHGAVAGAQEAAAPRLNLVVADRTGGLTMIDLASGDRVELDVPPSGTDIHVAGDGRFVYRVVTLADGTRTDVIDTGRWSSAHGDHFHHYVGPTRLVGSIEGPGLPVIRAADQRTAIAYPDSGRVVVLAHDDLADGELTSPEELALPAHAGLIALPYTGLLLATVADAAGGVTGIAAFDERGDEIAGTEAACAGATDAVRTRVGAVFACADSALLITGGADAFTAEVVTTPSAGTPQTLDGRAGRPSVAGVSADGTAWRLDSRARSWSVLAQDARFIGATAVSDDAELTLVLEETGAVRVLDATGGTVSLSEPLVAASIADRGARAAVRLIAGTDHAYLLGPREDAVFEIDYRDGAAVTRVWDLDRPVALELVG